MTMSDVAAEFRRPASLWRDADPSLRRLILAGFVEMLSVNAYFSLIVPFSKTLGLDSGSVGSLNSVLQVVSALTAVFAGVAADRASRKLMYVAGQVMRFAITLALLTTHSYSGLIIVFVLRGLVSIQSPAQQALMAGFTQRDNRATMLALWQAFSQLASILMPIASGAIADAYGVRLSFLVGGVLAAVAIVIGLGLKDKPVARVDAPQQPAATAPQAGRPERVADGDGRNESLVSRARRLFSGRQGRVVALLAAANFFNGFGNGAFNVLLPFTIMDRFSSAYSVVASAGSVMAFGSMVVMLIGGRMADLGGRRKMVITSGLIFPLAMVPIFFITQMWQLAVILVLTSMIGNISSPALGAIFMEAVEDRDRGTFAGLQMSLNAAGAALGSIVSGLVYKLSPNVAWAALIVMWFMQVVCYHFVVPHDSKRAAKATIEPAETPASGI